MREIKFRGKHIHTLYTSQELDGEWQYGYLSNKNYINSLKYGNEMLVDENTVGQYTGFKDKNGKEIYEGDILGGDYYVNGIAGKVEFYEGLGAWLLVYAGGGDEFLCKATKVAEVIGNIYEEPELLKA